MWKFLSAGLQVTFPKYQEHNHRPPFIEGSPCHPLIWAGLPTVSRCIWAVNLVENIILLILQLRKWKLAKFIHFLGLA